MRKYKYTFAVKYVLNDRVCKEDCMHTKPERLFECEKCPHAKIMEISRIMMKKPHFSKSENIAPYWMEVFENQMKSVFPNTKPVSYRIKSISCEDEE